MDKFDFENLKNQLEDYLSKAEEHHFSNRDDLHEEGASKVLETVKAVLADLEEQDRYNKQFDK